MRGPVVRSGHQQSGFGAPAGRRPRQSASGDDAGCQALPACERALSGIARSSGGTLRSLPDGVSPGLPLPLICGRGSGETISALANGGVARVRSAPQGRGSRRFARMAPGAGYSTGLCGHALSAMRESSSRKSFFSAARQAAFRSSGPSRPQGAPGALSRPSGRQAILDLLAARRGVVLDCGFVRSGRELLADRWGRQFSLMNAGKLEEGG